MLIVALVLFAGVAACHDANGVPKIDFERMRFQRRYEPYGANSAFANGAAMQAAPRGTQSIESGADSVAITPELLATGQKAFAVYCAVCHGAAGFGGSLVAENMGAPRPGSLRSGEMRAKTTAFFFDVATKGKGRMPPLTPQLSASERWAVAAYVGVLQRQAALSSAARADSLRADEIRGIDSALASARERR
jgi:mono/diheme cytochrome c family protein